jgi:hypothetical protein
MADHPTPLGGTCSARFEPLRELFVAKLASGEDLGASLAVNLDGEMLVDLLGGWADETRTKPWSENTITCVRRFSSTTPASMGSLPAPMSARRQRRRTAPAGHRPPPAHSSANPLMLFGALRPRPRS